MNDFEVKLKKEAKKCEEISKSKFDEIGNYIAKKVGGKMGISNLFFLFINYNTPNTLFVHIFVCICAFFCICALFKIMSFFVQSPEFNG